MYLNHRPVRMNVMSVDKDAFSDGQIDASCSLVLMNELAETEDQIKTALLALSSAQSVVNWQVNGLVLDQMHLLKHFVWKVRTYRYLLNLSEGIYNLCLIKYMVILIFYSLNSGWNLWIEKKSEVESSSFYTCNQIAFPTWTCILLKIKNTP